MRISPELIKQRIITRRFAKHSFTTGYGSLVSVYDVSEHQERDESPYPFSGNQAIVYLTEKPFEADRRNIGRDWQRVGNQLKKTSPAISESATIKIGLAKPVSAPQRLCCLPKTKTSHR